MAAPKTLIHYRSGSPFLQLSEGRGGTGTGTGAGAGAGRGDGAGYVKGSKLGGSRHGGDHVDTLLPRYMYKRR